jgi:hypothetical protein
MTKHFLTPILSVKEEKKHSKIEKNDLIIIEEEKKMPISPIQQKLSFRTPAQVKIFIISSFN